ncbi:MAG TPA: DNA double-strand break repair nuclease NurA [Dehalococcoidia bacterium]|nr:DNA double-strand break repair nuclease NurA [Dehalococcoidia bacterium]
MTLDLVKVAASLPELVERARLEQAQNAARMERALALLRAAAEAPAAFAERVERAETSWSLALPHTERLDAAIAPPAAPADYAVLAVDGSSIDVDRNLPVECYVLNFGWMSLQYGGSPFADFNTRAELQPTGDELFLRDASDPSREAAIRGAVLDVVRGVRELALLAELAETVCPSDRPLLALLDGNLALWNLEKRYVPPLIAEDLKHGERGTLQALRRLERLVQDGRAVFSGYVSRSGASNVVNSLRLLECPMRPAVQCRACPGRETGERPCDAAGLPDDAALMLRLLQPWQRSAVFLPHRSTGDQTAERWYEQEGHRIAFFYLRAGDEIARVELPLWMAEEHSRLELLHALLVRQAQSGANYPVALQEAHEQAVISTTDRMAFSALIARECELHGIPWLTSSKALSKRVRGI